MAEWNYGEEVSGRAETSDGVFFYDESLDSYQEEGQDSSSTPGSWESARERLGDVKHPMRND